MNYQSNLQAQLTYAIVIIVLTGIGILIVSQVTNIF
jgi:hypothetical protein